MDDEAEVGKGKEGEAAPSPPKEGEDKVSKSELDKVLAEKQKLEQQIEDLRLEVITPEYMEFLDSKEKGGEKGKVKEPKDSTGDLPDDKLESLSKKEILELATRKAKEEVEGELKRIREDGEAKTREQTQREIAAFARTHSDFQQYRPIMYGLSTDPKNADMSLEELYQAAKEHVKRIGREPTEEEKEKQRKKGGEKPGGASSSFEEDRKLSAEAATRKAVDEVKAELGPIPAA